MSRVVRTQQTSQVVLPRSRSPEIDEISHYKRHCARPAIYNSYLFDEIAYKITRISHYEIIG